MSQEQETIRFGDLYLVPSRNGVSKPKRVRGEGFSMVNMGELFKYDRICDDTPMELVPLTDTEKANSFLETNDLLFARQSLVAEGAGKCSQFIGNSKETTFESHLIRVRIDPNKADPRFYYYYFTSPEGKVKTQSLVMQVAAAGIRGSELQELSIAYPKKSSQIKISKVLTQYDDLIENNLKRIKILEEMAQTIYNEWFVNFRFPGYEKVKLVDSKTDFGEIPEGWKIGTIEDIANLQSGYSFKSKNFDDSGGYQVITIKSVHDGQFKPESSNFVTSIPDKMPKHCILEDKDILLSLTGNVGRVCMVHGTNKLLNQRVAKIDPVSASHAYVYSLFRSKLLQVKMQNISNGAAQQNLSPIQTVKLPHVVPGDYVLEMFEDLVSPMLDEVVNLNKQTTLLKDMRDLLIHKLVNGELEIKT